MNGLKTAETGNKTAKMKTSEILQKLQKVKRTQSGWNALCPSHNDKQRSLSVKESDGKILLKCFAGCDVQTIVSALGLEMKDLFESSNGFHSNGKPKTKRIVETYDYTDENGDLLFQSVRYEPKDFRQRRIDGNGDFIWNLENTRLVLYRLPEILASPLVYLVEGEKDVETLRSNDLPATCNPMGAGKWRNEYNEFLRDKTVVVLPDNDEPGRKHTLQVANSLYGIAKEIVILELPNLKPKGDVSDFIANGGTIDDIIGLLECAAAWEPIEEAFSEGIQENESEKDFEETEIKIKSLPVPDKKCFYGLAGEFVRLVEPHTESSPIALLAQFLVYFGNIIGHAANYKIEGDRHYTNLFCVLVGKTAQGRKGTSFSRVKEVFRGIDELHEKECLTSGLASGEGLLYHVRDPQFAKKKNPDTGELEEVQVDAGVLDKRLLIVEGEFAQVLRVQGRDSNTLSTFIRNLWDFGSTRSLTKNSPIKTTDAHVSIIGHITPEELLITLSEVESANGYANRFLFFFVERARFLPFGGDVPEAEFNRIQEKIKDSIEFAKQRGQMNFSIEASKIWIENYSRLETSRFGFLARITQRASPYVLRLSLIFALLDKKLLIEKSHLEAALAVWQYAEDSARYIFGERLENLKAEKILKALREAGSLGLTRTQIRDLFDRNAKKHEIDAALQYLLENKLAFFEKQQTGGKSKEVWFAVGYDINDQNDQSFESDKTLVVNVVNVVSEKTNKESEKQRCPDCERKLEKTPGGQLFCPVCLSTY
jgi:hypothetical protein